jgi:hypothetical protein
MFSKAQKIVSGALLVAASFFLGPRAMSQQVLRPNAADPITSPSRSSSAAKSAENENPYHEDFFVLPVQKTSLKLEMAVLGETDDKPGLPYIRERWHLDWRPGDPIDVYILKPRGVTKSPVVLYLYSFPQDTDRFKTDSWGAYATANGFAAVGFVSALTGHRLEYRPPNESFFNQFQEALGASVHDVQMILNFLESRKDLDMSRVGMFGQGSGGSIAILASTVDPRIKAVDTLTPWGDWSTFVPKSPFIPAEDRLKINNPEFLARIAPLDPLSSLSRIKARSLRIQDVRKEGHMPDACQELMEAAAPDTAEINQFGDSAALVPAAANGKLLDWIKSQLQPDAKPQVAAERSVRVHFFPPKLPTGSPINELH